MQLPQPDSPGKFDRIATPAERLNLWRQPSSNSDCPINFLPNYESLSHSVLGSTFHLYGLIEPKDIIEENIEGWAEGLNGNIEASSFTDEEKSTLWDRVRTARAGLFEYLAHQTLQSMKTDKNPLPLERIETTAKDAALYFAFSRDRSDVSDKQKSALEQRHAALIENDRILALSHSIMLDVIAVETEGAPPQKHHAEELAQRVSDNVDALLISTQGEEEAKGNSENNYFERVRCDIKFACGMWFLPSASQRINLAYTF